MTLTELVEIVSDRTGAEPHIVWGFVQSFVDVMQERLDLGDEVKVRGIGTFKWVDVPARSVPRTDYGPRGDDYGVSRPFPLSAGRKLKFFPANKFKYRRTDKMPEETDMTKYAVVTDEETDKEKQASTDGKAPTCRACSRELDSGGACPVHGTAPFEPSGG